MKIITNLHKFNIIDKNSSMNNTIIFLSLLILCLSAMLIIKIYLNLDINNNLLLIELKLYGIKIITIKISLVGLYYQINNSKKIKPLKLVNKKDAYFIMQIKKSVFDKLYYDNITFKSTLGIVSAKDTALIISLCNLIGGYIKNRLKINHKEVDFDYVNNPNFVNNQVFISINLKVYFTIFDLGFALILSLYKRGKYVE